MIICQLPFDWRPTCILVYIHECSTYVVYYARTIAFKLELRIETVITMQILHDNACLPAPIWPLKLKGRPAYLCTSMLDVVYDASSIALCFSTALRKLRQVNHQLQTFRSSCSWFYSCAVLVFLQNASFSLRFGFLLYNSILFRGHLANTFPPYVVKLLYSRVNKVFLNRDAVVEQLQNKDDFPFPVRNRIINFMTSLAKQKRRFNKWDFGGFIRKFSREQFYVRIFWNCIERGVMLRKQISGYGDVRYIMWHKLAFMGFENWIKGSTMKGISFWLGYIEAYKFGTLSSGVYIDNSYVHKGFRLQFLRKTFPYVFI